MNPPDSSFHGIQSVGRQSAWQVLLLVAVICASALMVAHMREVMNPLREARGTTNVAVEPVPEATPPPRPQARPFVSFDETRGALPEKARASFADACAVLSHALSSGAKTLLAGYVRHPQITMPRVLRTDAARRPAPAYPLEVGPKFGLKGDLLVTTVKLVDGTNRAVVLENSPQGFLLDWEGYTGWCEASFQEMRTRQEGRAALMRINCQHTSGRSPFANEKGISLVISHPVEKETLSAFVPEAVLKRSPAGEELRHSSGGPFVLLIEPDRETIQHGWVRVEEVICSGWVTDR